MALNRRQIGAALAWLGVAALIFLVLWPLLSSAGIPAFQQDWNWPIVPSQCVPIVAGGFEPWHEMGLGVPAAYPESFIYHALAGSACVAFGPKSGLIILLACALALAASGYFSLTFAVVRRERLAASTLIAATVTAFAIANPVVLNKCQAGHLKFLLAYAVLPWVARASINMRSKGAAWIVGTFLALAALDPQFMVFGVLTALAFFLYGGNREWIKLIASVAIMVAVSLQQIIPALLPSAGITLNVQAPVLFWQRSQSGSLIQALVLGGYIGGYAHRLLPEWVKAAYWLLPCAASLAFLRPQKRLVPLLALGLASVLIVIGWNSPFAEVWSYAFFQIRALAIFRELYNAIVMLVVVFACGLAIGISVLRERFHTAANLLCACCNVLAIAVATYTMRNVPLYMPSVNEATVLRSLANEPGIWRFAVVPGAPPMSNADYPRHGGYSPWDLSFAWHGALFSGAPNDVDMYTHALLRTGASDEKAWLTRDNVGYVKYLKGWSIRSVELSEPSMRRAEARFFNDFSINTNAEVRNPEAALVAVEPFTAQPGGLDSPYAGARDLRVLTGGHSVPLQNFFSDVSPATGWGRTSMVPVLPAWAYTEPTALFTLRSAAGLQIPPAMIVAGDSDGRLKGAGCKIRLLLNRHFRVFDCGRDPVFAGTAPIVVSQAVADASIAPEEPKQGTYGTANIRFATPWRITALVHASRGSAIVLRETYAKGWNISVRNARHVMIDGYANAWIAPADVDGLVTFYYAPAGAFFVLLAVSMSTLLLSSAMIAALRRSSS